MSRRGGRPPKLTPEVQQKLVEAIAAANTFRAACAHAGIGYTTFAEWMRRGKAEKGGQFRKFRESIRAAQARAELSLATQLRQLVAGDWRATLALLGRRFPKDWADRSKIDLRHAGKIEVAHAGHIEATVYADPEASRLACELLERLTAGPDDAGRPGQPGQPGALGLGPAPNAAQ